MKVMRNVKWIQMAMAFLICVSFAMPASAWVYGKAMKYPTSWAGTAGDHTYGCAQSSGTYYCWSWTGGQSGGSYLSSTLGKVYNYTSAKYCSTQAICKFKYFTEGFCHQETNRNMYTMAVCKYDVPAHKTVYNAAGYWFTTGKTGTYGYGTWSSCKSTYNLYNKCKYLFDNNICS